VRYLHDRPRERPDAWEFNQDCLLARGLQFLGAGQFPGSTLYRDSSLYHNDGTLVNGPTWGWSQELGRPALQFSGGTDYCNIPITPTLAAGRDTGPITVAFWVRIPSGGDLSSGDVFFRSGGVDNGFLNIYCSIGGNSVLKVEKECGTTHATAVSGTGFLLRDQWFHVAAQWTGGNNSGGTDLRIYRNGVQQDTPTTTGGGTVRAGTGDVNIGNSLLGRMSDTGQWNRLLSDSEISALADPSNTLLAVGGVPLLQPIRRLWAGWAPGGSPASNIPIFVNHFRRQRSAA
jgi:hypothetical protein